MSGYQQGGHYDDGYGHPAGHGDSYYQDEHAAQGYYDNQEYGDGYYDRGYGHLSFECKTPIEPMGVKERGEQANETFVVPPAPMHRKEVIRATPKEDTTRAATRMNTTPTSTTMPARLAMAGVDVAMTPRRIPRPSVTSP